MPGTARQYGLNDPWDVTQAIDAQGRLMRDLLRRFGSVPLALAAYNAGPAAVARCGCIPPYPETRAYVARILGLLGGTRRPVLRRHGDRRVGREGRGESPRGCGPARARPRTPAGTSPTSI
jgi:hypothetical protein